MLIWIGSTGCSRILSNHKTEYGVEHTRIIVHSRQSLADSRNVSAPNVQTFTPNYDPAKNIADLLPQVEAFNRTRLLIQEMSSVLDGTNSFLFSSMLHGMFLDHTVNRA